MPRLSYANVVATLALFVALGGGAVAATKITGKQIAAQAITAKQLATQAVGSKDIKNNAIRGADIKQNAIKGSDIKEKSLNVVESELDVQKLALQEIPVEKLDSTALALPVAYARVEPDGGVVDARNIADPAVDKVGDGTYCIDYNGAEHVQASLIEPTDGLPDAQLTVLDNGTLANDGTSLASVCGGSTKYEYAVQYGTNATKIGAYFSMVIWE
jgi:hypothetical protein